MAFIFLSHSSKDADAATGVRDWLKREQYEAIFLDHHTEDGIVGGELWEERLYTELRQCRALIALVSANWLASPWSVAEASHAQALRKPVIPLELDTMDPVQFDRQAPPILRRVQRLKWNGFEAGERLRRALTTVGIDPKSLFAWQSDRAPYPGLAAFQRKDAAIYFGREQEITDLLAILRRCRAPDRSRLVLVQGASGTGKSSLLRAGVLPHLERDSTNWIVVPPFRPLADPFRGLADALGGGDAPSWPSISAPAKASDGSSHEADAARDASRDAWIVDWTKWIGEAAGSWRRRAGQPDATILLCVDQLEEVLAPSVEELGGAFLLALCGALATSDHRLLAIATLRADFSGTLQRQRALREPYLSGGEILATQSFQFGPLPRAAFHAIIEGPAALADLELEPGLASRLVDDAKTDDALPLLAFTLHELWVRFGEKNRKLTLADYKQFGGLEQAVGTRADEIIELAKPSASELAAFRTTTVFRMVDLSADGRVLRRRLPASEVPEPARRLCEEFARARLFVAGEDGFEIAHEALFRQWNRLRGWLEEAAADLRVKRRAEEAASDWKRSGEPSGSLWRSPDLDLLRGYSIRNPDTLTKISAEFLSASERQASRERKLRRGALALIILLAFGAAVFGWRSWQNELVAQAERRIAIDARARAEHEKTVAVARGVLAESQAEAGSNEECSLDLALTAYDVARRANGLDLLPFESAVRNRLAGSHVLETLPDTAQDTARLAWRPNGTELGYINVRNRVSLRGFDANTAGRELDNIGEVKALEWHPDGKHLLVSKDEGVEIWDPDGSSPLKAVSAPSGATPSALRLSKDGKRALAWSTEGTLLLDFESDEAHILRVKTTVWRGHAWSPDSSRVAIGLESSEVWLFDLGKPSQPVRLSHNKVNVTSVAWSPDGQTIAVGLDDGQIWLWNAERRERLEILDGHTNQVHGLDYSPDGRMLASVSQDRSLRIWDASTHRPKARLTGHTAGITEVRWNPAGGQLATASDDRTVRLWSVPPARSPETWLETHGWVWGVGWTADGASLAAVADHEVVFRAQDRSLQRPIKVESQLFGASWASSSPVLAFIEGGAGRFTIFDTQKSEPIMVKQLRLGSLMGIGISAAGKLVAVSSRSDVTVWPVTGDGVLQRFPLPSPALAFSPKGDVLARAPIRQARVILFDLSTKEERSLPGLDPTRATWGLAWSHDGRRLAAASDDGVARIWDLLSDGPPLLLQGHSDAVKGVAWAPNGDRLATASLDGTVRIWEMPSGRPIAVLAGHASGVRAVAWSMDGRIIASGAEDGTARLFRADFSDILSLARQQEQVGLTPMERKQCLRRSELDRAGAGAGTD
ncbi:MAG TPA: TIR domain-containing protein [Beijerinckiaceae bacterium]|jgi:WD40 repeat protein